MYILKNLFDINHRFRWYKYVDKPRWSKRKHRKLGWELTIGEIPSSAWNILTAEWIISHKSYTKYVLAKNLYFDNYVFKKFGRADFFFLHFYVWSFSWNIYCFDADILELTCPKFQIETHPFFVCSDLRLDKSSFPLDLKLTANLAKISQVHTVKINLACQHVKLRKPHIFVAYADSIDQDDQKLI